MRYYYTIDQDTDDQEPEPKLPVPRGYGPIVVDFEDPEDRRRDDRLRRTWIGVCYD